MIEQLKASQEQLASDHAKAIEQLKTSQEQMLRDDAKVLEQFKGEMASFIAIFPTQRAAQEFSTPTRPIATLTRLSGADASVATISCQACRRLLTFKKTRISAVKALRARVQQTS
jgi:hypothetical protein